MSSDFKSNSYLYGTNETYLAQMFARYLKDPGSVDSEWLDVFQDLGEDEKNFLTEQKELAGRRVQHRLLVAT